jgi:hypothetical protein
MTGNLDEAIRTLLTGALPDLLTATPPAEPAVTLLVTGGEFTPNPLSAESIPGEPRTDDRTDSFPFDPLNPPADFMLTQPPYPGARRVRLTTDDGDRIPLRDNEVVWDRLDSRRFSIALAATRDLSGVTGVDVLYGVAAVFTALRIRQAVVIELSVAAESNLADLERAAALAVGVIELNRQTLIDNATAGYTGGDYQATLSVKSLKLTAGSSPVPLLRRLTYQAEVEIKAARGLREDEGLPIRGIRSPGRPVDPNRPVDVAVRIDA